MLSPTNIKYQTTLTGNIVLLCRFLRKQGYTLSASDEKDALNALSFLPIDKEKHFKEGLKTVLSKNKEQRLKFDRHYEDFWEQLSQAADGKIKKRPEPKNKKPDAKKKEAQFEALKNWLNLSPSEEEKEVAAFSAIENLTKKDFSDLSKEELRLMMRLLQKMARKLAHQKSRLTKPSHKHKRLDLKRTVRASMRKGGEIQKLLYSEKKERKLKIVLLCDVSKSMELYSRFFVHLIYAFQNAYDKIETFVFSTALHRVSDLLNNHEFDAAFDLISERVPHWSGGTTIGSCLHDFKTHYSYSLVDRKTIVLILSDGWDTGAPEVLSDTMKAMHKKAKKIIWLNPLAGNPNFTPEAMGMQAALPYVDVLGAAHNLESLKQALSQLQKKRKPHDKQW